MSSEHKYLIFGMGALGSVFAAMLMENGCDVTVVGRGEHFKAVKATGLKIDGIWGDHVLPPERIRVFMDPDEIKDKFPVILLCVKSMHTEEAAGQAAGLLKRNGIMVSIQNGLNNWESIAGHVGGKRTVGARVIFGADIPQPGLARVTVYADKVLLGAPFDQVNHDLLRNLEKDLNLSGIPSQVVTTEKIWAALWGKVLYNSALNPLSAILKVTYGRLGENEETRNIMRIVVKEIFEVMEKRDVRVPFKCYEEYFDFFMKEQLPPTSGHTSSMLQDVLKGRRTEIDALNGAISQYAKEMGVSTPYNDLLTGMIKFMESNHGGQVRK